MSNVNRIAAGYQNRLSALSHSRRHRRLINSITGGLNIEMMIVVGVLAFLFIH